MSDAARARPPWSFVLVATGLALVSLLLASTALLLGGDAGEGDGEQDRASALSAARERTARLTSYDFRTLDADFAAVLTTATGDFDRDFLATSEQLRPIFVAQQAVATANVVGAGLESSGSDRAVAVVAVDQVISASGAAPRTERNRLRMTLIAA